MTPAQFRKHALALEGATEVPHMERQAFRTKRKIFATLGADRRVNMQIEPADRRDALLASFPGVFHDLGGWTRLGYLGIDLAKVETGLLLELLRDAYGAALPAPRKKKRQ